MAIRNRVVAAFAVVAVLAASMVLASAVPAGATTSSIVVTSNADEPGTCPSADNCTLMQAIVEANLNGANQNDDVTISIAPGLGSISLAATLNYNGGSGSSHALTIDGNGVTITTAGSVQLFSSTTTGLVTITETTWTNGDDEIGGGAVSTVGSLTITDSTFSNNSSDLYGGAVSANGDLEMHRVEFEDNDATRGGGAFRSGGTTTISDASFIGNSTDDSAGVGLVGAESTMNGVQAIGNTSSNEGGVFLLLGDATITDSAFLQNSSLQTGGVITCSFSECDLALLRTVVIGNSTGNAGGAISGDSVVVGDSFFSGNSSSGLGGGIFANYVSITTSSFIGNMAATYGGAAFGYSGFDASSSSFIDNSAEIIGGALVATNGDSTLVNSTVAGNVGGDQAIIFGNPSLTIEASTIVGNTVTTSEEASILVSPDLSLFATVLTTDDASDKLCSEFANSAGFNFANDTTCGLAAFGDREGPSNDPLLSTLDVHGSPALTMIPLVGSPLVGAIPDVLCSAGFGGDLSVDQRGFARPNVVGGPCDIGAIQLTPAVTAVVSGNGELEVSVTEFASTVSVTMYSTPTLLGTMAVNELGAGTSLFALPCDIEGGVHTITATAASGQTASMQVTVDECLRPAFAG